MSFVSIFAAGPCLVSAADGDSINNWSGMLGLSSSHTFADLSHTGETVTLTVDAVGLITLSTTRDLVETAGEWLVTVQPSSITGEVNAESISTHDGANDYDINAWADGVGGYALGMPYAPIPFIFPEDTSQAVGLDVFWS